MIFASWNHRLYNRIVRAMQITLSNPGAACTCVCAGYEILYAVVSCKHNAQQRKRGTRANEEDELKLQPNLHLVQ